MKFSELYRPGNFCLSFEVFPPRTSAGERALLGHVAELQKCDPSLITCTYGAGGSTRNKTLEITSRVADDIGCSVAAHLTCVGNTLDQLTSYLEEATQRGIQNIVALRGDPPRGEPCFRVTAGGLQHANELVAFIKREFPHLGIAVAGYPETHQEALTTRNDLKNLRRKVDAGADVVLTQLFYNNKDFFRFRDRCDALGIDVPIVPGLLPITNLAQVRRISSLCNARLPEDLIQRLQAAGHDPQSQFNLGIDAAVDQTQGLIESGIAGIHFYVVNQSAAACQVLQSVSLPA